MFKKSLFTAAAAFAVLALAGAGFAEEAYQGGPKSGIVKRAAQQPLDAYAQAVKERKGKHVYQGGPWTNIPMATH